MLLLGCDDQGVAQAAWIDSFHTGDRIMQLEGALKSENAVSIKGSYSAPPGPDWGWRIVIHATERDAFKIVMYNIAPQGEESLAVESNYTRQM